MTDYVTGYRPICQRGATVTQPAVYVTQQERDMGDDAADWRASVWRIISDGETT